MVKGSTPCMCVTCAGAMENQNGAGIAQVSSGTVSTLHIPVIRQ